MIHDEKHELVQDEAIKRLAAVVASLAAGANQQLVSEVHAVVAMLDADEAESVPAGKSEPPAPPEPNEPEKL